MSSLPDDILFKILREVPRSSWDLVLITKLPLVCKKWREVLYLQGGHHPLPVTLAEAISSVRELTVTAQTCAGRPVLQEMSLGYNRRYYSLTAMGQWHLQQQVCAMNTSTSQKDKRNPLSLPGRAGSRVPSPSMDSGNTRE